jgi:hypothetical protein
MHRAHGWAVLPLAALMMMMLGAGIARADGDGDADNVPSGSTPTVTLQRAHVAYARPGRRGHPRATVSAHRPITGVRTVLPVRQTSSDDRWVRVSLPGRPNGRTGWISVHGTRAGSTPWRIVVDRSRRTVAVYRHGRVVHRFGAVVGTPSTPTPVGRFFVEEPVRTGSAAVGGPYALALSARSTSAEYDGVPLQIAFHGRDHLAGSSGEDVSYGCVRLTTRDITWLARTVGAGVPVVIRR